MGRGWIGFIEWVRYRVNGVYKRENRVGQVFIFYDQEENPKGIVVSSKVPLVAIKIEHAHRVRLFLQGRGT